MDFKKNIGNYIGRKKMEEENKYKISAFLLISTDKLSNKNDGKLMLDLIKQIEETPKISRVSLSLLKILIAKISANKIEEIEEDYILVKESLMIDSLEDTRGYFFGVY